MVYEETKQIRFTKGNYKYKLVGNVWYKTPILGQTVENKYIQLCPDGWLLIRDGYAWDGASGPAVDTPSFMRASLIHDAIYQLIREGLLHRKFRQVADKVMRIICKADGMWLPRRWWVWRAVRNFGNLALLADKIKDQIFKAPGILLK